MKNWTVKEAAVVIGNGEDVEAIKEIVKHFPMFSVILAAKNFDAAMAAMPESLTVRKIENGFNAGAGDTTGTEDAEDAEDAEEAGDVEDVGSAEDLGSMTKDQLIAMCDKKGVKVQRHQKPKQYYIDMLSKAGNAKEEVAEKPEKAEKVKGKTPKSKASLEEAVEEDPVALYKKCKKAGLNVKPRQSAKYYSDALAKAAEADEEEADDDGWADDEEVEEKPVKAKAKVEDDSDDSDDSDEEPDWDI